MPSLVTAILIALVIAWLAAEFKSGKATRITLGLLAIVVFHLVLFTATQVVRGYEKDFMRFSFRDMKRLLQSGRSDAVIAAIETYQAAVTNDTSFSFQGSFALKQALRQVTTNSEPDGAANGSQPIRSETNSTSSAAGSRR